MSAVAQHLDGTPLPMISILEAHLSQLKTAAPRNLFMTVLSRMQEPPLLSGEDVMRLGIPEGQRVGLLLGRVRRLQLDGIIESKEEAVAYLCTSNG